MEYLNDDFQFKLELWMMWSALVLFTIWLALKLFGVINTPVWLAYFPFITATWLVAGFLVSLGK